MWRYSFHVPFKQADLRSFLPGFHLPDFCLQHADIVAEHLLASCSAKKQNVCIVSVNPWTWHDWWIHETDRISLLFSASAFQYGCCVTWECAYWTAHSLHSCTLKQTSYGEMNHYCNCSTEMLKNKMPITELCWSKLIRIFSIYTALKKCLAKAFSVNRPDTPFY